LRIVGGSHRGRRLAAPPGRGVRPTPERVREALFDILAHNPFATPPLPEGARVLDAFAGSGALGFEALSRGARSVLFLETDTAARGALLANARTLGEEGRVRVLGRDATRPGPAPEAAGLAFLDAPYGRGLADPALAALAENGWLAPGAVVAVELSSREALAPPPGFTALDARRYGTTRVVILRFGAG